MNKKFLTVIFFSIGLMALNAQKFEYTKSLKATSIGEREACKIYFYNADLKKCIKLVENYMKNQGGDAQKKNKDFNEYNFDNLRIDGDKFNSINILSQAGSRVEWSMILLNENNENANKTATEEQILKKVFFQHIVNLYEDSLEVANKLLAINEKLLEKEKNATVKNDMNSDKSSKNIEKLEQEIDKMEKQNSNLKEKLDPLRNQESEKKASLSNIKSTKKDVDALKDDLNNMKDKLKQMKKNLSNFQKDPVLNANLITAQTADIQALELLIPAKEKDFKIAEDAYKSKFKAADKAYDKIRDELKETENKIKSNEKDIEKNKKCISKLRAEIAKSKQNKEVSLSETQVKLAKEIEANRAEVQRLKEAQKEFILK